MRCAEVDSRTAPLIDLMTQCHSQTSLESTDISGGITSSEKAEILAVLQMHHQVFSSRSELSHEMAHENNIKEPHPASSRIHQTTDKMQEKVCKEIASMLELGIITESLDFSSYGPQKEGTIWFCVDYRKLKAVLMHTMCPGSITC